MTSRRRPDPWDRARSLRQWVLAWLREGAGEVEAGTYSLRVDGVGVDLDVDHSYNPHPHGRVGMRVWVDGGDTRRWEERRGRDVPAQEVAEWILAQVPEAKAKVNAREEARARAEREEALKRSLAQELGLKVTHASVGRGNPGLGRGQDGSWTLLVGGLTDDEARELIGFAREPGLLRVRQPVKAEGE